MLATAWTAVDVSDEALAAIPMAVRRILRTELGFAKPDETERPER